MSNRTKMYQSNSKARAWLVDNGYTDIHLFPHTRFSKDIHFKGMGFDGIATKGNQLALFQIKTNCACTKKMKAQMEKVSLESGVILLWIDAVKRKGAVVTTTGNNAKAVVTMKGLQEDRKVYKVHLPSNSMDDKQMEQEKDMDARQLNKIDFYE